MCKKNASIMLTLLLCSAVRCTRDFSTLPASSANLEFSPLEKSLVQSDNAFGIGLFREIAGTEEKNRNVFVSPLSVAMALGMTLNGAAGQTEASIRNTLGLDGLTRQEINQSFQTLMEKLYHLDPGLVLTIANSIWSRQDFAVEKAFADDSRLYFQAPVRSLDFSLPSAADVINAWVHENTRGKIEKIVDRIARTDILFLVNAIYFKGVWMLRFDKTLTQQKPFALPEGSPVSCDMMSLHADLSYWETAEFQAVNLHYGNESFGMAIFLPKGSGTVDNLISALTPSTAAEWMSRFAGSKGTLNIPKFTTRYETELSQVLSKLGMGIAFTGAADFSRIHREGGLQITRVLHKTFVQVDEEGTEAAAVTAVVLGRGAIDGFSMTVDRPFLFLIHEKRTGAILFIGKMANPVQP